MADEANSTDEEVADLRHDLVRCDRCSQQTPERYASGWLRGERDLCGWCVEVLARTVRIVNDDETR